MEESWSLKPHLRTGNYIVLFVAFVKLLVLAGTLEGKSPHGALCLSFSSAHVHPDFNLSACMLVVQASIIS